MIGAVRTALRYGFELIERPFERLFGPALNPLAQLGALGFFFYWIVAVSGIYLFIFFDTGIERAYESVEYLTYDHWYHAGVMRSLHRYASDLMVVMLIVHLLREFAYDHYRGVRWYSWFTGLPIIWLLYSSGITGYWLVWDRLAHYVAITSSELLDYLPIFGEPIARNFIATGTLTSRFFTLMVFMHIAVPLFLLVHHVGAYPAHLAAEGEPAATARDPDAGRAVRGVAVEAGAVAGPGRSCQSAGRDRARLVLSAALSADRHLGARRGLGIARRRSR